MAAPRILAVIVVDGKEVMKKPVHASSIVEVEEEARKVCADIKSLKRERVLVYDRNFEDYIDDDDHVPVENDKIRLHFTSKVSPVEIVDIHPDQPSTSTSFVGTPASTKSQSKLDFVVEKLHLSNEAPRATTTLPEDFTDHELEEKAKIFGNGGKVLNKYQQRINGAAAHLAKSDQSLLHNRGELLKLARKHLHESGYDYAHGKATRSKVLGNLKRENPAEERLYVVREQLESIEEQIKLLDKGKMNAIESNRYGQAASFEQQKAELKLKLRKLRLERQEIEDESKAFKSRRTRRKSEKGEGAKKSNEAPRATTTLPEDFTDHDLEEKAKIFGNGGKVLNKYQQRINGAAAHLAKSDPSLLHNRGELLKLARKHLHESGYDYAHGKATRSKVLGKTKRENPVVYSTGTCIEEGLDVIREQLESIADYQKEQILFLDKRKMKAVESNQYGQAASFEQQ